MEYHYLSLKATMNEQVGRWPQVEKPNENFDSILRASIKETESEETAEKADLMEIHGESLVSFLIGPPAIFHLS